MRCTNKKFVLLIIGILVVAGSCYAYYSAYYRGDSKSEDQVINWTSKSDDQQFLDWMIRTVEKLMIDGEFILSALKEHDLDGIAMAGKWLYDDCDKALSEIDRYHVSPALEPLKNEFKLYLQDLKQAGYYYNRSARNINPDDIKKGNNYLESALGHFKKVKRYLEEYYQTR
ncbi:MAG: hypothetical protein EF806_04465 [Candidatus Methanoliparum thermophilum]|uniref:Uncharacterized protein n=1 Tax=Methanoliparum thermophilum TaxID=2491083 RepID=A0A520KS32_METT2|nr:hypothetical protein [Candidatus Methanoliparum sp. LAM-1]RZN64592.1 MAG: hypothetical protein EF806_04465 [Candidatus Methanoliparum thermophilum]BDC35802.1 hypothetical protein MTLP_04840 [Candidatus Methanoliparum sp. LAM-1]